MRLALYVTFETIRLPIGFFDIKQTKTELPTRSKHCLPAISWKSLGGGVTNDESQADYGLSKKTKNYELHYYYNDPVMG